MAELSYRGCVINYPEVRMHAAWWTVNLGSNEPHLFNLLGGKIKIFDDAHSLQGAIDKAKFYVDQHLS